MDWQLWQVGGNGKPSFGEVPRLEFHRISRGMGFAAAPPGATFDRLTVAPPPEEYTPTSMEATPGLLQLCRVQGTRRGRATAGSARFSSRAYRPLAPAPAAAWSSASRHTLDQVRRPLRAAGAVGAGVVLRHRHDQD